MTPRARLMSWSFALDRAARGLATAREELAFRFLTERDWLDLGRAIYGRAAKYSGGSDYNQSGLLDFERDAVQEAFPPPPASLLVGGCGGGRELFALLDRGYHIAAAYDPVTSFIEALRSHPRLLEMTDRLWVGSHQEIESFPALSDLRRRGEAVDAVVVGWTSYAHILRSTARVEFLRSLRTICPRGPVLVSFFLRAGSEPERPRRLRTRLRRILGTTEAMVEEGDVFHRGAGAIHYFTETSFASEARAAGYRVQRWNEHDFAAAHAILVPDSQDETR